LPGRPARSMRGMDGAGVPTEQEPSRLLSRYMERSATTGTSEETSIEASASPERSADIEYDAREKAGMTLSTWLIRVSIALQFLSGVCEGPSVRG
jgi:hypothetical protein